MSDTTMLFAIWVAVVALLATKISIWVIETFDLEKFLPGQGMSLF